MPATRRGAAECRPPRSCFLYVLRVFVASRCLCVSVVRLWVGTQQRNVHFPLLTIFVFYFEVHYKKRPSTPLHGAVSSISYRRCLCSMYTQGIACPPLRLTAVQSYLSDCRTVAHVTRGRRKGRLIHAFFALGLRLAAPLACPFVVSAASASSPARYTSETPSINGGASPVSTHRKNDNDGKNTFGTALV